MSTGATVTVGYRLAGVALVGIVAAGCGSGSSGHQPQAAVITSTPVPTPSTTGTGSATLTVNTVVDGLRTHGLDAQISDISVYSAQTDPAHQLGKPGSYLGRATFTDSTLPAAARAQHTFARGGTVEVFRTAADARAGAARSADRLPGERDLLSGPVLLRLSPAAPSTLEDNYRTALHETTGTPAQPL